MTCGLCFHLGVQFVFGEKDGLSMYLLAFPFGFSLFVHCHIRVTFFFIFLSWGDLFDQILFEKA